VCTWGRLAPGNSSKKKKNLKSVTRVLRSAGAKGEAVKTLIALFECERDEAEDCSGLLI